VSARPFRHLCPEADARDAMSEVDFWDHVLVNLTDAEYSPPEPPDPDEVAPPSPCPLCGEVGACAYDTEGRALIHATDESEEL
jgi:hypothetical protein